MEFIIPGNKITIRSIRYSDAWDIFKALLKKGNSDGESPFDKSLFHNHILRLFIQFSRYTYKILKYLYWKVVPPKQKRTFRFGISLNQTGRVVGMVILSLQGQQLKIGGIGFWLTKQYWGQGIMTEAVTLAIEFGFSRLGLEKIRGWTVETNIASQKVMQKCGLKLCEPEDSMDIKSPDEQKILVFQILKSEYKAITRAHS
jgi:RimJ/RimL family protein N-acetyltransferase